MKNQTGAGGPGAKNICLSCRHYYLTYEVRQPYGCRAMGFRSLKIPSQVAFENSGMCCQLMEPKTPRETAPVRKPGP